MLAAHVAHLDEPFELGGDVSRVAIGAMADQHLDEVRRVGGEPISPVGVFEAEHLLPAALERQGDGDPVPSRRGDRHGAIDVVDEDAEPAPGRAATFGGDVAECLGDQPLGSLQPRPVRGADRRRSRTAARRSAGGRQPAGTAGADPSRQRSGGVGGGVVVDQRPECRRHRCRAVVLEDVAAEHHATRAAVEQVAGEGEHGPVVARTRHGRDRARHRRGSPGASTPRREGFRLDDVGARLDGLAHQRHQPFLVGHVVVTAVDARTGSARPSAGVEVLALGLGGEDVAQAGLAHAGSSSASSRLISRAAASRRIARRAASSTRLLSARSGDRYRLVTSPRTVSAGSGRPSMPASRRAWPADINTPSGPTAVTASRTAPRSSIAGRSAGTAKKPWSRATTSSVPTWAAAGGAGGSAAARLTSMSDSDIDVKGNIV